LKDSLDLSLGLSLLVCAIFVATLLLALTRPGRIHEGVWTTAGALAMLATGGVHLADLREIYETSRGAVLFLVALLILSALVDRGGLFDWAALHAARGAKGSGRALFRNVFWLGAAVTATLSLDTTAVLLTPIVLAFVRELELPAAPYVIACAFAANAASLALPVSNLSNLILTAAFQVPFADFVLHMLPAQAAVLAVTYASLRGHVGARLRAFDPARVSRAPAGAIPHRGYFRTTVVVLGLALVGYMVAPLASVEPYVVAFVAAGVLAIAGVRAGRVGGSVIREVSWGVVPFVLGLFVVVQGLEGLGLAGAAARLLAHAPGGAIGRTLATTGAAAVASNAVNNLPATLVVRAALASLGGPRTLVYAALVGTNVGPNLVPFGSLASVLVLTLARERGVRVSGWAFARAGLWATPLACVVAALVLALTR
jgi:arsenical pump membrane protein